MAPALQRDVDTGTSMKTADEHLVIVILPDAAERETVCRQLEERGFHPLILDDFAECLQMLQEEPPTLSPCVICPLTLNGQSGLEFQQEIKRLPHATSVVFLDAPLAIADVVQAMRQGAVAVVETGDAMDRLIEYIEEGIERSSRQLEHELQCRDTLTRLGTLSVGEHQVLRGIMLGKLNREIACFHQVSVRTIEQRRRDLFRKMDVQHAALLVRRVTEAVRTPVNWEKLDPDGRWLEAIRDDAVQTVVGRLPAAESADVRLVPSARPADTPPQGG